jgi:ribosomal protein S20
MLPVLGLLLVGVLACGGPPQPKQLTPSSNRPGWVDKGGGFFTGDQGRAFYGVGAASNISSPSLRKVAAESQARADIARVFKSKVDNMVKIYTKSVSGGPSAGDAKESAEQLAMEVTKTLTSLELTGATVVDRYYDPQERTQYALAVLDLNAFKDQISQMEGLSRQARAAIEANADEAFAELDRESDKARK